TTTRGIVSSDFTLVAVLSSCFSVAFVSLLVVVVVVVMVASLVWVSSTNFSSGFAELEALEAESSSSFFLVACFSDSSGLFTESLLLSSSALLTISLLVFCFLSSLFLSLSRTEIIFSAVAVVVVVVVVVP